MAVGVHILADLYGVDSKILSHIRPMKALLDDTIKHAKLTKLSSDYYQFKPFGVSGVVFLAESHISIHTWPEYGLLTLDIYTCGAPESADEAFKYIVHRLKPKAIDYRRIERGKNAPYQEADIALPVQAQKPLGINTATGFSP